MGIKELITDGILLLDGAMGTMLQKHGLQPGEPPEVFNVTHPEVVAEVHRQYLNAGSRMILTNTFGANEHKLKRTGHSSSEIVEHAVKLAKQAAEPFGAFVALDMGPIGELLAPSGMLEFDEAYELFKTQVVAGVGAGADAIVIETMTDLMEIKCALLAAKENSGLPVLCTMSFEKNMRTFMGVGLPSMALTLSGLGADAIGLNCSVGPAEMAGMVRELVKWTNLPIIAKPNAGLPEIVDGKTMFLVSADEFAGYMSELLELGVSVIGGCCGTTPEFIARLAELAAGRRPTERARVMQSAVCSHTKAVVIDRVRIIGERINPTGKQELTEALLTDDMDVVADLAIEQSDDGAEILDLNAGVDGIDEKRVIVDIVRTVQSVVNLPLQIDSTDPEVIEAGLRACNGKAVVNSVSGRAEALTRILPIAKKYGAAVIGLTLDENGIPRTAQARFAIAERIIEAALGCGIPREDIFIDCLVQPAGAQTDARTVLETVAMVKNKLNVRTVLGVSNISYGLPARARLNRAFLAMALYAGLDLPIMNPNEPDMTDTVYCYHLLMNIDAKGEEYIRRFKGGAVR